jgi:hypothetical protein
LYRGGVLINWGAMWDDFSQNNVEIVGTRFLPTKNRALQD